ncbi:conserved hypothetical protein [Histoplasma capsulatum var. duboisii H88]|uniref:Uncharacterized protein n=1 Tax=Ajellomyces capsulatus (strain H88) TaxID=544711 RepID=F0USM2_AJEC8|nr:conserved hypothetical protein [Histoplasma capsulatum var. duboisii H88]QSS54496.1 hypothetical protein I7I53_02063 [Histoplasma capsulatum var. duboisii H88]
MSLQDGKLGMKEASEPSSAESVTSQKVTRRNPMSNTLIQKDDIQLKGSGSNTDGTAPPISDNGSDAATTHARVLSHPRKKGPPPAPETPNTTLKYPDGIQFDGRGARAFNAMLSGRTGTTIHSYGWSRPLRRNSSSSKNDATETKPAR